MNPSVPEKMKAAAIDRFGGPEVIHTALLPVPEPGPRQVLIRLDVAGIGVWDPWVREGGLETQKTGFPRVIGNDGAGVVVAVAADVTRFSVGDPVYAFSMDGGFYAEYVAVDEDNVAGIPAGLRPDEAGALGADAAVDGRKDDVKQAARAFAPEGINAALVLANGRGLLDALSAIREGGRVAYPNGVEPAPDVPEGVEALAYDGTPDRDILERLNALIGSGPFHVELGKTYRLDDASAAHREIEQHHLGKLALRVRAQA